MKISKLRNLGVEAEKDFESAGIKTAEELMKLEPKEAFLKILKGRAKRAKKVSCCNALYLYAIYGAIYDMDWRMIPETKKEGFKHFTKSLREKGKKKDEN